MDKLETIKKVIEAKANEDCNQLYFSRNTVCDPMETLYVSEDVKVLICYSYGYFEVLGLTKEEKEELKIKR